MLSICIPIYNFDVNTLLEELEMQISASAFPIEIVCIDDCSEAKFKLLNQNACKKAVYVELEKNIGRAKIRNLFLEHSKYENLLFLDCDAKLIDANFLHNYADFIQDTESKVVFGGSVYESQKPNRESMLAWKYGHFRQTKAAQERSLNPYQSFMTNNFIVKRSVFEHLKFDETIKEYGHEDTLFGLELMLHKIPILHLQNPVYHIGIDPNLVYLNKVETSIKSLLFIQEKTKYKELLEQNVSVLRIYFRLKKLALIPLIKFFYFLFKKPLRWSFQKGYVHLRCFDFYKLGYYVSLMG